MLSFIEVHLHEDLTLERLGRDSRHLCECRLANTPEVVECFEVSGEFDYIAKLICPDIDATRN